MHQPVPEECFAQVTGKRRLVQDGWDSLVAIVEDAWVVRIPRSASTAQLVPGEVALLKLLASRMPVAVPEPVAVCTDHQALLYRLIPGASLHGLDLDLVLVDGLANQLTAAVQAVHNTDLHAVRCAGVPDLSGSKWHDSYAELCSRFRQRVLPELPDAHHDAGRWLLDGLTTWLFDYTPEWTLVHRDLGPSHLLCQDERLAGIIDWTDACIGDRAIDFAWLLYGSPPPLARRLVESLNLDDRIRRRALAYHQLGPWYEVEHGIDKHRSDLIDSGIDGVVDRLYLTAVDRPE